MTTQILVQLLLTAMAASETPVPQETVDERLDRLEQENAELRTQIDALGAAYESSAAPDLFPPVGPSYSGLGPAASKVYQKSQGLSIGGYGEAVYKSPSGGQGEADFLRNILYFGYKFTDQWVLNTEIEIEHADEIFLEFAYLDYLNTAALNFRIGMLLVPLGFINEIHEPTTFYSVNRPDLETRLIPSTWRQNGLGVHGDVGPITYRAYLLNGFDGTGFGAGGLRGGRQKASRAKAEDIAFAARADWTRTPGLLAGLAVYHGNSGQGEVLAQETDGAGNVTVPGGPVGDIGTTIVDAHVEYQTGPLRLRGLWAAADLTGAGTFNAVSGEDLGSEMEGWYVEAGYDVFAHWDGAGEASLTPFVRFEDVDTQSAVPGNAALAATSDRETLTVGVAWQPHPNLIFKVDVEDSEFRDGSSLDQFNLGFGYVW